MGPSRFVLALLCSEAQHRCLAAERCMWRQTGRCLADGPREPWNDVSCFRDVRTDFSGFCDCDANQIMDSNDVRFDCHTPRSSCATACEDLQRRAIEVRQKELKRREAAVQQSEHELKMQREQRPEDALNYQVPEILKLNTYNIAITGGSGSGKSHLINALRGATRDDPTWAPVGVDETTMKATPYQFSSGALLWDLPGAGTQKWPFHSYVQTMGLRYFNSVIVVYAGRFTENTLLLIRHLEKASVPFYVVRQKVHTDVENNWEDNGLNVSDTFGMIKREVRQHRVANPYLLDSRQPNLYDFSAFRDVLLRRHEL